MSVITLFGGTFCNQDDVVEAVQAKTGYNRISDKDLVTAASRLSGLSENRIARAFSAKRSVFDRLGHENRRAIACLKLALAQVLAGDHMIIDGFSGQLIPQRVTHVLRVCLIADMKYRVASALGAHPGSEKDAAKRIARQDEGRAAWMVTLFESSDPWNESLYDIVLPMHETGTAAAADVIAENSGKKVIQPTRRSRKAVHDFLLAVRVEETLMNEGHFVDVDVRDGTATLTIHKQVLRLGKLEAELQDIAGRVDGVSAVETKIGETYHRPNVYRKHDFSLPSKVLLVDDEREFVQILSERLVTCDIGAEVCYDAESALELINEEEPEIMIVDLRMPGVDGFSVLKKVKETRPNVEVIILTAHESRHEKEECMRLGAFAYLQKPVDIELLSETLRRAKEKIGLESEDKDIHAE
ncbi:MAG TPA: response regulator [Deltaproteobacteria bacterium]|nr:response regulator [Deltaproteobacteria bacterium]